MEYDRWPKWTEPEQALVAAYVADLTARCISVHGTVSDSHQRKIRDAGWLTKGIVLADRWQAKSRDRDKRSIPIATRLTLVRTIESLMDKRAKLEKQLNLDATASKGSLTATLARIQARTIDQAASTSPAAIAHAEATPAPANPLNGESTQ